MRRVSVILTALALLCGITGLVFSSFLAGADATPGRLYAMIELAVLLLSSGLQLVGILLRKDGLTCAADYPRCAMYAFFFLFANSGNRVYEVCYAAACVCCFLRLFRAVRIRGFVRWLAIPPAAVHIVDLVRLPAVYPVCNALIWLAYGTVFAGYLPMYAGNVPTGKRGRMAV